jgi:hypothetical protein
MPFPGGGWPSTFEVLHGFGMFAAASLLVGVVLADDASDEPVDRDRTPDARETQDGRAGIG